MDTSARRRLTGTETMHARTVGRGTVAFVVAAALAVPSATAQDLEDVAADRRRLEERIDAAVAELDELERRIHLTRDELASLEGRAADLEAEARAANSALQDRARQAFMRGQGSTLESLLSSDGPQVAVERARLLAAISHRDIATLESSAALRVQTDQVRALLTTRSEQLVQLEAELEARSAELQEQFEEVDALYGELKTRRDRQVRLARGAQSGTYACIFSGAHDYRDTWGAPRSGGRRHQGTDVFAAHGAPVYAFTDGTVQRYSSSALGGIGLYVWGDDGVQYYYAHLASYAPGVWPGERVEAGQLVAYNGASGNASMSAPHVHFEVHPGGGGAVNPYHWLTPVC